MSARRARAGTINLAGLALPDGGGTSVACAAPVEPLDLAGQRYNLNPAEPEFRVEASRSSQGYHLRLLGDVELEGPCWRCVEVARLGITLDSREFAGFVEDDPELCSEYVEGELVDVGAWARDAISEELPPAILCRADCPGLCAGCGANLSERTCDCQPPDPDSRWAALGEMARRLDDGA